MYKLDETQMSVSVNTVARHTATLTDVLSTALACSEGRRQRTDSRATWVRTVQVHGYAGFPINDTTALYMYFLFLVLFPGTFSFL